MPLKVTNERQDVVLASHVERASRFWGRLRGLLGRDALPPGHGLWIDACGSIHTFFMRFPIDAVFLGGNHEVLRVYRGLKPFRLTRYVCGARAVLELPAGTLAEDRVRVGDRLAIEESA
ncbi:MAG: DUF192 domain-containing protein [Pseudomonadota bacterium]